MGKITLEALRAAMPGRNWVRGQEVIDALGITANPMQLGHALGKLGLCKGQVRAGRAVPRVWLIRGEPEGYTSWGVLSELVAHGYAPLGGLPTKGMRAKVVSLPKSPNLSPR